MNLSISIKDEDESVGEVFEVNGIVVFEPSRDCSFFTKEQMLEIIKLMDLVKGEQNGN